MIELGESKRDPYLANLKVGVVVPAAGSGQRMEGKPKPFLQLDGQPVLRHVLNLFLSYSWVKDVVVALPEKQFQEQPFWLKQDPKVQGVLGGATRRDSVWNAIQVLSEDLDLVIVHDGARPLTSQKTILDCVKNASEGPGAVAGIRVVDTLKTTDKANQVLETLDRKGVWRAQTPQVFTYDLLFDAYHKAIQNDWIASDDSIIVKKAGGQVRMVESSGSNFKITVPTDLDLAEAILTRYRF
ncbi:MAG TPA: 2-C-methyl-D-erythritol 4-phosphate cytidylyltransferase [Gemmatimonadetes bacterium]|nr:2-C-methyl-D-erythritol 4-phosphate cytidylyltransferase [Gemmatimonadota bacterium]